MNCWESALSQKAGEKEILEEEYLPYSLDVKREGIREGEKIIW